MPSPSHLLALFACIAVTGGSAPRALALDRDLDDDSDSLAQLLRAEGIEAAGAWDPAAAEERLALRRTLRHGFAHTESLPTALARWQRQERWLVGERALQEHIARLVLEVPEEQRSNVDSYDLNIPVKQHALVDTYIDYFTGRGRWFFARWLARADRYLPIMQPILERKGLPTDTIYLAMIESGFVARAHSTASAVGFWQFIASTGDLYRLRRDAWVDERRDFIRATEGAANYLNRLHREFGDWHLAWASYNAGEGRIRRALAKHGVSSFWALIEKPDSVAKETQHYVPKIIAAAIVATHRERYGFAAVEPLPPLLYDEVELPGPVALQQVASQLKIDPDELTALNPELLLGVTPPHRAYTLRVPSGRGTALSAWLRAAPPAQRLGFKQHVVRSGDTLWRLAERYGTTIVAIREFNNIRSAKALRVGQPLVIPRPPGAARVAAKPHRSATKSRATAAAKPRGKPTARHVVGPGETLWSISRRYQVSVDALKRWNERQGSNLGVGEVLKIF